ncbi:hypothetical protein [Nitrosomonas sp.]|uniref:hypothetical protein n=1 Tax=Nitrosomonas sp. TaxID=42353 RepID=UPI0025DA2329|nr:hypothetical protein [Nitrosomonas sp.]
MDNDNNSYLLNMIEDCEVDKSMMSDWECEFIETIRNQIDEGRNLSEAQIDKLEEIWETVTENG